jgi:hypothetical protein
MTSSTRRRRRSRGWLADLGAAPGERIAVQVEKSRTAVLLYLAALRAGVIFVPLNTAYTAAEIGYFLGDAEPVILVCDPASVEALGPLAAEAGVRHVLTLDADGRGTLVDRAGDASFETVARTPDDLAAILYTSGTTGRSKGAMLSHRNLLSNALTLKDYWRWQPGDVLLHALPIYHVHGLFVGPARGAAQRIDDVLPPQVRSQSGDSRSTCGHGDDGCADLLHATARYPGVRARCLRGDAAFHQWFGAAARSDLHRFRGAHRPPHPRALRHDRGGG